MDGSERVWTKDTFFGDRAEVSKSIAVDVDELIRWRGKDGQDILSRHILASGHSLGDLVIEVVDDTAGDQLVPVLLNDDLPRAEKSTDEKGAKSVSVEARCVCVRA